MDRSLKARELKSLFTSRIRLAILSYLAFDTEYGQSVRDFARHLNQDYKNVSRELKNLEQLGIVKVDLEAHKSSLVIEPIRKGTLFGELWSVLIFDEVILRRVNAAVANLRASTVLLQPHDPGIVIIALEEGGDGFDHIDDGRDDGWPKIYVRRVDPGQTIQVQELTASIHRLPTVLLRGAFPCETGPHMESIATVIRTKQQFPNPKQPGIRNISLSLEED